MRTVMALILAIILSGLILGQQFKSSTVIFPETTKSNAFKVPQNYYLTGLEFATPLGAYTTLTFLVSNDGVTFDTLYFNGAVYEETIPSNTSFSLSLDIKASLTWEWWKLAVTSAIADSVDFEAIFGK